MTGHERLLMDLRAVLHEAERFEFHDFKNSQYATPKVELVTRLEKMKNRAISGKYDNDPKDEGGES